MPSHRDTLTSLTQRLVQLVGASAALNMVRKIPKLVVDSDGTVLDYDREDPRTSIQLLIEHYQAAFGEIATSVIEQATHDSSEDAETPFPQAPGTLLVPPITIVVVDDHVLVREGLVSLIDSQPDLQVVGQAGSLREAVTLAHSLRPHVILMDFTLPDGTGDDTAREILSRLPNTKIVFLTAHDDDDRLFAAIAAGATGYLLKSVRSADLLSRLRGVVQGEVAFSPAIGQRILAEVARQARPRPADLAAVDQLTAREVEILRLIVQGHTNRQIADGLNLSVRTIEYHRANLTSKLGLHSRADLVHYAAELGLFSSLNGRMPVTI